MGPRCSIVIPVHNQAELTQQCLDSIFETGADFGFEVIVVDDASTDSTPKLVDGYRGAVRSVRHVSNKGFATSCNDGAAAAASDLVIFLNNDTIPQPGWLDALVGYTKEHPQAGVVASKLLFPDGTIQHAGVVICQDGWARHIYAGLPGDHPAVCRSRRFQVVTAACALVRRGAFERVGGFDTAFRNGHEDVDFCLKLGELGYEVHYCHESVLYHLESASRGRTSDDIARNGKLYYERWADRVVRDDLRYYVEDRLLRVSYDPLRLTVSGELAHVERVGFAEVEEGAGVEPSAETTPSAVAVGAGTPFGHLPPVDAAYYERVKERVPRIVEAVVPPGATIAVISKGDDELTRFADRPGLHFPCDENGEYAGFHPSDGAAAVASLDAVRAAGADHLVIPATSFWWLSYYADFAQHLESHCRLLDRDPRVCLVFSLTEAPPQADADGASPGASLTPEITALVRSILPDDADVLVAAEGNMEVLTAAGATQPLASQAGRGDLMGPVKAFRAHGGRYVVVVNTESELNRESADLLRLLSETGRVVTRQQALCQIFDVNSSAELPARRTNLASATTMKRMSR